MNQSSWRATRLKNLHGPGFVVGPSYEESFLNQCQSSEWQQKSTPEWIPPNQVDELVRRCEEQVIKARRSFEQSVFSSLPRRTSEDRLITNALKCAWKKRLRRGAGRGKGVLTATVKVATTLGYFRKFWFGRGTINRRPPKARAGTWTVIFKGPRKQTFELIGKILNDSTWFIRYFGGWTDEHTPGPRTFVDYAPGAGEKRGSIVVRCKMDRVIEIDGDGARAQEQRILTIQFPINSK
jgi:hypothetical protein